MNEINQFMIARIAGRKLRCMLVHSTLALRVYSALAIIMANKKTILQLCYMIGLKESYLDYSDEHIEKKLAICVAGFAAHRKDAIEVYKEGRSKNPNNKTPILL